MTAELVKTERADPLALVQLALEKGADPSTLQGLYDLAARWKADSAREAFAKAMSACQSEIPAVLKDKENTHTRSMYASFEALNIQIKPIYSRHGFGLMFYEGNTEVPGNMRLCLDVIHQQGHVWPIYLDVPFDGQGIKGNANMTATQGKISTVSYGRRTLTKMAFNIAEIGEDQDGNLPFEPISSEEALILQDLINDKKVDLKRFLDYAEVKQLSEISKARYPILLDMLRRKKANGNGGPK